VILSGLTIWGVIGADLAQEEKLSALRRGFGGESLFTNPWFILTGTSVVFILMLVLVMIQHSRLEREEEKSREQFEKHCDRYGLTDDERIILSEIAHQSGINHQDLIFSQAGAFERGLTGVLAGHFAGGKSISERKELNVLVDSIKGKIGITKRVESFGVGGIRGGGLSSRGIPVGKEVSIEPAGGNVKSRVNAVVTENREHEFVLRPEIPVRSGGGEVWSVHYEFGPARWEFKTAAAACGEEGLVLNHSDGVQFINRRRFLRVGIEKPALVAYFPMVCAESSVGSMEPDFVRGKVTELSGPGLRIDSELTVLVGDRILVIFELEPGRFFEDVGVVRWCNDRPMGSSMGVELIGLSDSGVDELVRITNLEAIGRKMAEATVGLEVEAVEEKVHG
jgi:hypothetical protein